MVQAKALTDSCRHLALERKSALDAESEKPQTVAANSAVKVPGWRGQAAGRPPPPPGGGLGPEQAEALGCGRRAQDTGLHMCSGL